MATITYIPPKNYPEEMRLSLMDGRTVLVVEGAHTYPDMIVDQLRESARTNSAINNMLNSNILILQSEGTSQGFALTSTNGQNVGHLPPNPPMTTNSPYQTAPPPYQGYMPPIQSNVQGVNLPGYTAVYSGNVPGYDSAPLNQTAYPGINQYDDGSGNLITPRNADGSAPIQVDSMQQLTQYPQQQQRPKSAIRANGQTENAPTQIAQQPPAPKQKQEPPAPKQEPPTEEPPSTSKRKIKVKKQTAADD